MQKESCYKFVPGTSHLFHDALYHLSQERFNLLRKAFQTDTTAKMQEEEIPAVLRRYLECLAVPIIPADALRNWPTTDPAEYVRRTSGISMYNPPTVTELLILEHSLAILNLRIRRVDLLVYLLLCMYTCDRTGPYKLRGIFVKTYGPDIVGRSIRSDREYKTLEFLVNNIPEIVFAITFLEGGKSSYAMEERYEKARARLTEQLKLKTQIMVVRDDRRKAEIRNHTQTKRSKRWGFL